MSDIVLSSGIRSNLLALQRTADLVQTTQERLSTGRRVNSALDDATNFFTSQSLNNRASDLTRLLDGIGNAVQTLEAADDGITAITQLVENAQAIVRQAQQSPATNGNVTTTGLTLTGATNLTTGLTAAGGTNFEATDKITVTDGTDTVTFAITATSTVQDLVDAINADANLDALATITADGRLQIENTEAAGGTVTVGVTDVDTTTANDVTSLGLTVASATSTGTENADRTGFAAQFDDLRLQIDQLAADASFNGVNLLDGDGLTVIFNEDDTSSLSIAGITFDATGLGINTSTNGFQDSGAISTALTELDAALNSLRAQSAAFGTNLSVVKIRESFTEDLVNTLEIGADNLVLADINEEGANLLALQTREQLSSTALSLASQSDQSVLRLFG
ncbi:MAG: flagellin [Pseudomonadota bacterium]